LKRTVYIITLAIGFSLIFSQGKPCCKSKANKDKVACKFNLTNIDGNKDIIITDGENQVAGKSDEKSAYITDFSSSEQNRCSSCKTSPWWKFWAKKKDCCNT